MHIECMVMHDVQNESLIFFYQLGTLSPLPSGEKEVSQTPHTFNIVPNAIQYTRGEITHMKKDIMKVI